MWLELFRKPELGCYQVSTGRTVSITLLEPLEQRISMVPLALVEEEGGLNSMRQKPEVDPKEQVYEIEPFPF